MNSECVVIDPDHQHIDPITAAQRLLAFVGAWGSGVIDFAGGHQLTAEDIEAAACLALSTAKLDRHGQFGAQWTDSHGDVHTDPASSRDTAYASVESLRVIQKRRGQRPDAIVKRRAVGPWVDDTDE